MRPFLRLITFLTVTIFYISTVTAQEARGAIHGKVTDASQGVLAGAGIELQPSGKTTVSDSDGEFSITGLNPGKYSVTVSNPGFALHSTDVTVSVGKPAQLDAVLQIGTKNEVGYRHRRTTRRRDRSADD